MRSIPILCSIVSDTPIAATMETIRGAIKSGRRTMDSNACPGDMKMLIARLKNESSGNFSGTAGAVVGSLMIHSSSEIQTV
jgi:hypothetical protein